MNDITNKLEYLNETKTAIKNAIIDKGIEVSDNTTFRAYADKITAIGQKPPTQEKSVTITSNTTTTVTPDEGYALSAVTAITNVPNATATNCIKICGSSGSVTDGVNASESGSATLPANKKGYVVCLGTATGNLAFTVSPYTSVSTPVNQVHKYNNMIHIRNTLSIYTINSSTSSRTVSVKMTSSDGQARHVFAFLIY